MANRRETSLPPGPVGRWRPTLRILRDPRCAFVEWSQKYGDPFFVHALNGPVVITGRPDLIRQIFSHDPMDYEVFAAKTAAPILGEGSMLLISGQPHRRERKLVMPMFHGDRMRAYANIMQQVAIDCMQRQPQQADFQMLSLTTQISLNIIVQAIFGGEEADSINRLVRLSRETIRRISPAFFFSPKLRIRFFGLSPWDRFLRAQADLQAAFDDELTRRRDQPANREDILTMLTQAKYEDGTPIEPSHARDELGTFLFAGHETSAIAMAWAIYHLHSNPETLTRLRSELSSLTDDSPEALAQLPYLKAVVQETLRLHPIVTEVLRIVKSPMELDGYVLPVGTAVAPAKVLAHYREETYPQPDAFRPERFLDNKFSAAEYFPFGGGHRRCTARLLLLMKWRLCSAQFSPDTN